VESFAEPDAIRRCQAGDIAGFDWLVRHYQLAAIDFAFFLSGDQFLAEDIAQESLLAMLRSIERYNPSQPFLPWLLGIVTNVARQRKFTTIPRREISLESLQDQDELLVMSIGDPTVETERVEQHAAFVQALDHLTLAQREAIGLRYYFGFSDQEIATIVHCSPGAVRKRLHDGLKALEVVIRRSYLWLLEDQTPMTPTSAQEGTHDIP